MEVDNWDEDLRIREVIFRHPQGHPKMAATPEPSAKMERLN